MTLAPLPSTRTLDLSFHTGHTLYSPTPTIVTVWNGEIDVPIEYRADLLAAQIVAAACLGLRATKALLTTSSAQLSITHSPLSVAELSHRLLLTEYSGLFYICSTQTAVTTTHDLPIEDSSARLKTAARRLLLLNLDHNPIIIEHAVHTLKADLELSTEQIAHIQDHVTAQPIDRSKP